MAIIIELVTPFWKSIKLLKRKKKSPQLQPIKYCPQCREPTLTRTISGGWVNTEHYRCTNINCDYAGAFYLEVDPEENGKNLLDLEDLKREFPEDLDPETEISLDHEIMRKTRKPPSSEKYQER